MEILHREAIGECKLIMDGWCKGYKLWQHYQHKMSGEKKNPDLAAFKAITEFGVIQR